MHIRQAHASEHLTLSALAQEAKAHLGYSRRDLERWRPLLTLAAADIASRPAFVAELDNTVVGFYLLMPNARRWALDHLWVAPEFARRGIGRALLTHAARTAQLGGASSLVIDADPNAEPFYVACGAIRESVVAAPITTNAARVRPQLSLQVMNAAG